MRGDFEPGKSRAALGSIKAACRRRDRHWNMWPWDGSADPLFKHRGRGSRAGHGVCSSPYAYLFDISPF